MSFQFRSYLHFLRRAKTKYQVHSPFVFDLITKVLQASYVPLDEQKTLNYRSGLKRSKLMIEKLDLGTGNESGSSQKEVAVRDIARTSLLPTSRARILFRLARYFNAETIIELGTSLGITTTYLAQAAADSEIFTLEGCPQTAEVALNTFKALGVDDRIKLVVGNFDDSLPEMIPSMPQPDLVFFDGNHSCDATLRYFEWFKGKAANDSLFIFDDIHWSEGMERAWREIISDPMVVVSIDLYRMGLVFFKRELSAQHFLLRY